MPQRIVDADPVLDRRAAAPAPERIDKGLALAAVLQSIPLFVWAAPLVLLFGFILLALWYNREGHALQDFTQGVLLWASRLLIVGGLVLIALAGRWCYRFYRQFILDAANERTARANARKAVAGARNAELKNELLEADIALRQQIPGVILGLAQTGIPFKYDAKGNLEVYGVAGRTTVNQVGGAADPAQLGAGAQMAIAGPGELPTNVKYEEVRGLVPAGHILVGVGRAGKVETKEKAVGACVWIVGMSGTGKTSTTVLRVEERANDGHWFLGVDPHWFKADSLYHAIYELADEETGEPLGPGPYKGRFLMPMACTAEQQQKVLQAFLDEFNGRKSGIIPKPWRKITLLVDEVGALMDPTTEEEEAIKEMLPTIARICGQEARNFNMGGIFISQQATGLAWLRKMALMVIVHQLLMQNERLLAVNENKEVAKDMETWPVGRTYVYGVGFSKSGPLTVQQPYFARTVSIDGDVAVIEDRFTDNSPAAGAVVDAAEASDDQEQEQEDQGDSPSPLPLLTGDLRRAHDAVKQLATLGQNINARSVGEVTGFGKDKANQLLNKLADLGYINRPGRKAV
jgi:hypothetical protein